MNNPLAGKIGLKEAGTFAVSMATCLRSGIAITRALELAGGQNDSRLKISTKQIISDIQQGATLFESFRNQNSYWPDFFINAVRCGEVSGKLEESFRSLHRYCHHVSPVWENTRKIWFYPLVIIGFGLALQLILFGFFLEWKTPMFSATARSIVELLLLVVVINVLSQQRTIKYIFDWLKLQIPVLREFQLDLSMNQFFSCLSLLYSSNFNVVSSVEYAADAVENLAVRDNLYQAIPYLRQGRTIHESLSQASYIGPGFLEWISVGEQAGKLDDAFRQIVAKTIEFADRRMAIIEKTLFRILTYSVGMSVVGAILPVATHLLNKPNWYK